jgi:hypothetical protein
MKFRFLAAGVAVTTLGVSGVLAVSAQAAPTEPTRWTTFNAGPEPAVNDSAIRLTGHLEVFRNGTWIPYPNRNVTIQRKLAGSTYKYYKSAVLSANANLSAYVKAGADAAWRVKYSGNSLAIGSVSAGDFVNVLQPKDYANCTEIRRIYPHGVGQVGAVDRGGDVADFTRDNETYALNTESDRDNDRIACEA